MPVQADYDDHIHLFIVSFLLPVGSDARPEQVSIIDGKDVTVLIFAAYCLLGVTYFALLLSE